MKLSDSQLAELDRVSEGLWEIINNAKKQMDTLRESERQMPASAAIATYAWMVGLHDNAKKANDALLSVINAAAGE